jgi:DNA-binding CsgD family transcriptional regulator
MSLDERLLGVVDQIYQAALDPALWPDAIQSVADRLHTRRAALLYRDAVGDGGLGSTRLETGATDAYFRDYKTINPIQARMEMIGRRPGAATDRHYVDKSELLASDFHDRFMRPLGMHTFLFMPLERPRTTLNVIRDASEGEFEAEELAIGLTLMRPLSNAFEMGMRLGGRTELDLADFVWSLVGAVFVVGRGGRLAYANKSGEDMLAAADGLAVRGPWLKAETSAAHAELMRLIGHATAPDAAQRFGGVAALPRPSGRRALAARVTPGRGPGRLGFASGPLAFVSVTDPEADTPGEAEQLRRVFGLTPAEARVAAEYVAGYDPQAIAERLGLSLNTVRVQIVRIRAKTETSRQGEFIALALRTLGAGAWPRQN